MIPAGVTGSMVDQLAELMEPGDIIIDGGNSNYGDDNRPAAARAARHPLRGRRDERRTCGVWNAATA